MKQTNKHVSLLLVVALLAIPGTASSISYSDGAKRLGILAGFAAVGTALQIGLDNRKDAATKDPLHKTPILKQFSNAGKSIFFLDKGKAWKKKGRGLKQIFAPETTKAIPGMTVPQQNGLKRAWTAVKANPVVDTMVVLGLIFAIEPNTLSILKAYARPAKPITPPITPPNTPSKLKPTAPEFTPRATKFAYTDKSNQQWSNLDIIAVDSFDGITTPGWYQLKSNRKLASFHIDPNDKQLKHKARDYRKLVRA